MHTLLLFEIFYVKFLCNKAKFNKNQQWKPHKITNNNDQLNSIKNTKQHKNDYPKAIPLMI